MGPIKPHSNEKSPKSSIPFGVDDDEEDSSLKFMLDEESEILQENHGNTTTSHEHALQDITMENLQEVFQLSRPSNAFPPDDQEDSYQMILDIEKNVLTFSESFDVFCTTVESFESGQNHQLSDLIELEKECKNCSEEWVRALEKLGGVQLEDFQIVEKSKKENVVSHTNSLLDLAGKLISKIEALKTTAVPQQGMF